MKRKVKILGYFCRAMKFEINYKDNNSSARAGKISTARGEILTPIFMPVGTAASVKAVHQHELKENVKAQIILANTYHLYLRPGMDIIETAGGIIVLWIGTNPCLPIVVAIRFIH